MQLADLQAVVRVQQAEYESQRLKLVKRLEHSESNTEASRTRALKSERQCEKLGALATQADESSVHWRLQAEQGIAKARSTEVAHQEVVRQLIAQIGKGDRSAHKWEQMYWNKGEPHRSKGGSSSSDAGG